VLGPLLRLGVAATLVVADGDATQLAIGYLLATVFGLATYGALFVRMLSRRGALRSLRSTRPTAPAREMFPLLAAAADQRRRLAPGQYAAAGGADRRPRAR
jgi:hypothetical protein